MEPEHSIPLETKQLEYIRSVARRPDGSEIIYYLRAAFDSQQEYPIVVLCEGSYQWREPIKSIKRMHSFFVPFLDSCNASLITVEKHGVDGDHIDEELFHQYNTVSQRIEDHLNVLCALENQHMPGWNGNYVLIGGSEGGAVISELMLKRSEAVVAVINYAGIGAYGFNEEMWAWLHQKRIQDSFIDRLIAKFYCWWENMPATREAYDRLADEIIQNPSPEKWRFGQTYKYLADAFLRGPTPQEFYSLKIPMLVVIGTQDPFIESCDEFIKQANAQGMPVTYWRIADLTHGIAASRPDLFPKSIEWLQKNIKSYLN